MKTECYPASILPHPSRLFLDYVEGREPLTPFYPVAPFTGKSPLRPSTLDARQRAQAASMLIAQSAEWLPGPKALENMRQLRLGADAVVTGQQVGLFGGPLLTLLKAATAVRLAKDATSSGSPHVPIFWMATEDHDFDEVDHVTFPARRELRTIRLAGHSSSGQPVGSHVPGAAGQQALDEAAEFLGGSPFYDLLRQWYTPGRSMAQSFSALIAHVFAPWGLIVIDAASREAHRLGAAVLRGAIQRAGELQSALLVRDQELKARGYHSQVLVSPQNSLLFMMDRTSGARLPLRRIDDKWKAGPQTFAESELLDILESEPERLSPNALLRPVFQDAILPTSVYVGGPAEIAYFAQSQVLYERLLGHTSPVLPRLSATLVEPAIAAVLDRHEVTLPQVIGTTSASRSELAQRLGARAMPVAAKQALAAAGNALDQELTALTAYMNQMDESLGRAAQVSASKMRYQMNRLRRLAANFQLQKEESLQRHADALQLALFPERHPQERKIGGAYYLARYGDDLASALVDAADSGCPGHKGIWLA